MTAAFVAAPLPSFVPPWPQWPSVTNLWRPTARGHNRRDVRKAVDRCQDGALVSAGDPLLELISQTGCGDQRAFAALYDALASRVFGVITRVLRDPAMSEEVAQEVFVEIWTQAPRFDAGRASVAGWATMIARRRAIDRVRSEQSHRNRMDQASNEPVGDVERPDEIVPLLDESARIRVALDELPPDQREVIALAFLDGCTHHDIAARLDLPLGTVKSRVRLGLRRMRAELEGAT